MRDCHTLSLRDVDYVQSILERYAALPIAKEHPIIFQQHLIGRADSFFIEVGDVGLIFLTNVIPHYCATFNAVFWDGGLGKDRRDVIAHVCRNAFEDFDLIRLQAILPSSNKPLYVVLKKIGFQHEGCMRSGWKDEHGVQDTVALGMLRNEVRS